MADLRNTQGDEGIDRRSTRQRRLQSAIDKASEYSTAFEEDKKAAGDKNTGKKLADEDVRPMEEWGDIVSQRIEDAMRQGLFDGLSGHGKPLDLHRDPYLPEDQQMAVTLLRNNRLSPEWITDRSAILSAIDTLREEIRLAVAQTAAALNAESDDGQRRVVRARWLLWLRGWRQRMDKLNDRILVHNLKQPVSHLEIFQFRLSDELDRAGVDPTWNNVADDRDEQ